jgi:hypothetical protein
MDDRMLRELGELARQEDEADQARFDERWDRLAAGTLTAEEEAELAALAASSPEGKEAYEAFRPLGANFQARMVAAAGAELAGAPQNEPVEPPAPVLPFRRVARRVEVWLGAAAAVAASLFFLVRTPDLSSGYEASLEGGFKTDRGSETISAKEPRIYGPGSLLTLSVNPKQPLKQPGKVSSKAFLSSSAGRKDLIPLRPEPRFRTADTGSVILEATVGKDIKIPSGDWILWAVVARPDSMPTLAEVQTRLLAGKPRPESWQAACAALTMEETPPAARWQVACTSEFRVEDQPAR